MEYRKYQTLVEKNREAILAAERYIWAHPETGFKEWETTRYLAEIFEQAGYELQMAGDIPGFYADLDTGRPGPKVLIMGELDALVTPSHGEAVNGNAHACGHNAQCAGLVGVALALKEPGALDDLCGSFRLMAVPAEELIEVEFRDQLRQQGMIHYLGGKVEYLYRGYMDGCDFAILIHSNTMTDCILDCGDSNGCMAKDAVYTGVAAHAGGCPDQGVNALYAASMGLQAINALRETFRDNDHVRVHPILTAGGGAVNIIPAEARLSTFVRGASIETMVESNTKVNRALAAGALALGAKVTIHDRPGYSPFINDRGLMQVAEEVGVALFGRDQVNFNRPWGCGSTDMGDLSCVMRTIQPSIAGASGHSHGDDYRISDPETACVQSAVVQLCLAAALLENDAERGKNVLAGPPLRFASKEDFFASIDRFMADRELVTYENGKAIVEY